MTDPTGDFLDVLTRKPDDAPRENEVDVPLTRHEQLKIYVYPLCPFGTHASWVTGGVRLTFKNKMQAMKFRLAFKLTETE
jgi:hypothetical protein